MASDLSVNQDALKTLNDKIKGIKFAMLTTIDPDGALRSRPMACQDHESDGTLWFFTLADSEKVHEIQRDQQVNLTYIKPSDEIWVSVMGTAQLERDPTLMQSLWRPHLSEWFPKGLHDPNLALLKVTVARAEYWDNPSGIGAAIATLRNTMSDNPKPIVEDITLDISHPAH